MLKFLAGAVAGTAAGFVAGSIVVARGVVDAYKRDGNLRRAEAAIQQGLDKAEVSVTVNNPPNVQPLTLNQIRQMRGRSTY